MQSRASVPRQAPRLATFCGLKNINGKQSLRSLECAPLTAVAPSGVAARAGRRQAVIEARCAPHWTI